MTVRNINDHVEEFDRGLFGFLSLKYFVCASLSCFDLARACILEGYKTKWINTSIPFGLDLYLMQTSIYNEIAYIHIHPTSSYGIFPKEDNVMGSGRVNP